MNDQFIFFCVNVGNENLLKEEIKIFYPELTPSYSRKGFLTFKNKGVKYDFDTISQLKVTFATRNGICLGKSKPEEINEKLKQLDINLDDFIIHNFSINTKYNYDAASELAVTTNQYSADGKLVLNIISLGEKEIWFGVHKVVKGVTRFPNAKVEIELPSSSLSIGYLKLAEVKELYSLKFTARDSWLDFGCSPGGSSAFLLSTGAKVWGIDTANVDESLLSQNKSKFKFIKSSVQDLSQEQLPDDEIHWVHADLNLNPKQAIKEVLRLCKKYNKSLKGILFTVQIVKTEYIQSIEEFEDVFYDWGFSTMMSRQVPSHKNEYVLIAQRWN